MRSTAIILISLAIPLFATPTIPGGGVELSSPSSKVSARAEGNGKVETIEMHGKDFSEATRVTVAMATPDKPWSAYVTQPLDAGPVSKGDRLLVTYFARSTTSVPGRATAKVQISAPTFEALGTTDHASLGMEWQEIHQPLISSRDAPKGKGEVTILLGEVIQTIEIAAIRVLNYGPDFDLSKLPRPKVTYHGREAEAPWRIAALDRIEKSRMADYSAQITDAEGRPLAGLPVTIELHRHQFGFGTCVTRGMLTSAGNDGERYRDLVRRTCSRVVFENDLKPDSFPHDEQGFTQLEQSFEWLKKHDIQVRGHYLIQEAVDGWTRQRLGDPTRLRETYMTSIRERIEWVGDRVTEWDAINHPIAWGGAEMLGTKGPPLDTLSMDLFHEARRLTTLPLVINEDQLFRPGNQQDQTFALLDRLKREGVRVDGLGNQAHFSSSFLPSPEELLQVTDRFAKVVPKQVVTEFDIVTHGDEELAADYLRDCLIACFSHPAYDGFMLWGFWEGSHWIPEAALWRKDWSAKPIGLVWEEWTTKRFHTQVSLTTDPFGKISWRGYKGSYRVKAAEKETVPFHPGSTGSPAKVSLP